MLLTDALGDARIPEKIQTFDDLWRGAWLLVEYVTFNTTKIGVERVTVDEVDNVEMLIVVQRRTTVTSRCIRQTPARNNKLTLQSWAVNGGNEIM